MNISAQKPRSNSAQISLRTPLELRPLTAQAAAIQKISINRFIYMHGYEAVRQIVEKYELKQMDSSQP